MGRNVYLDDPDVAEAARAAQATILRRLALASLTASVYRRLYREISALTVEQLLDGSARMRSAPRKYGTP